MSADILLEVENLGFHIDGKQLLHNVSFSLQRGEITTVIGPNGAGKSTLVKVITGLLPASSGEVKLAPRLTFGYVPQRLHMDASLPIKVSRFLSLSDCSKSAYKQALALFDVSHLYNQLMHRLSGGELQRVLLARAVARKPDVLVLDEPLQGVDVNGQSELYRLIASLRDELDCAIFMVSHDLHLVMAQTDKVLCLNQHVCCQGQPESVSQHPEYLRLFGKSVAEEFAVYTHHHDHHHNIHGDAVSCDKGCDHA
ncbi:Zinc import ATP-binding protein ZnuC [Thalassocella blandensis]|nr:Zinc import ATP-binding protein ZnuC [Thalassocella blandensis]